MDAAALNPYLVCRDAAGAIDYYVQVLQARELYRLVWPDGRLAHAELQVGASLLMLAEEHPDFGALAPPTIGGTPVSLQLYVEDVDAALERGVAAGGTLLRDAKDEFYGDRAGLLLDPYGHKWHLATRRESLAAAQIQARWQQVLAEMAG